MPFLDDDPEDGPGADAGDLPETASIMQAAGLNVPDSSTRPDNLSAPAGETPGGRMVGNRSEPFQLRIRAAQQ